ALLRRLGAEVARLHRAGFVHGDLVPPNVRVVGECFIFLDNDRTRRSRLLVGLVGRRNLVQLGRFVVPGLTLSDRARVLAAYAAGRGFSRRTHRRLARWLVAKTVARRCAVDRIPEARVTYLPALRRWRAWPARLALPATVLRLARLARGADVLYACTLSSFPYCLFAGRLARVPQVVHVYSSYGDGAAYRKHLLG